MEFKDVLRERLEIEYTKRLFSMIPSKFLIPKNIRGNDLNVERCPHFKV